MRGIVTSDESKVKVAIYARVLSHEQKMKGDLERQIKIKILKKHCEAQKERSLCILM